MKQIKKIIQKILQPEIALAHCDIPCGVYETDTITHGVETLRAMTTKLKDLEGKTDLQSLNTITRMVKTKEDWAQKTKEEILILWTDYFKPEHLENNPELHETIWKATKTCSAIKREVNIEKVEELDKQVQKIKEIFQKTKN